LQGCEKPFMQVKKICFFGVSMAKKSAEAEKKKKTYYYGKKEKTAKEVKK
jgi:hypothetical protein